MNEKKGNLWKRGKRLLAALLALALVIAYFPAGTLTAQAETAAAQTDGETTPADGTAAGQTDDETQTPPAEDENDGTVPAEETGNVPAGDAGTTPVNEEPGTAPAGNGGTTSAGTSGTTPVDNSSSVPAAGGAGMTSGAGNEITPEEDGIATLEETGGNILETDGGEIEWNFKESSAPIYNGSDGSLSVSGTLSYNGGQHGANIGNGTVFTLIVPKGLTTITFGVCEYGSSTAQIMANNTVLEESFSLKEASSDGQEVSIQYMAESETTITITVSGNGYLHKIAAKTITPPKLTTVNGTVSSEAGALSAAGQTLVFTDTVDSGNTYTAVIKDNGEYSISLPIGKMYIVSFEQSDAYEVTIGETLDLTNAQQDSTVQKNITYRVIWDISKSFSFEINGTTFTVKPGASSSEDFEVTADGNGSVELATTDTAIIWADLGGAGTGTLTEDMLENVTDSVGYSLSENTITFTYKDSSMAPTEYTIQVKDNSASGNPHQDGTTHTYDFRDGSVVSTLHDTNYRIQNNNSVHSTDKLLTLYGESLYFHDPQHGIAFASGTQFQIKTAGNAEIVFGLCNSTAQNSVLTAEVSGTGTIEAKETSAVGAEDGSEAVFKYTGDAATITFTYTGTGTGYLHSISVTNKLLETEVNEQAAMPDILDYGNKESMSVSVIGQRLILSQEDGSLGTGSALSDSVGYYGFNPTSALNKLEADITINSCGNSSSNGVFFGVFDGTAIETVGIRNSTNLRGIYTREDNTVGAGRINETITEGQTVHFTAERTANGFVITVTPDGGETYTMTSSNSDVLVSGNGEVSFGFILANASVTVTNMKYYDANEDLLYDQNDCYQAIGTAPQASNVRAVPVSTRDAINVMWNTTDLPFGDAHYVIQVSIDKGVTWETVGESQTTSFLYQTTESGTYMFRVGGAVGSAGTVDEESYAESGAIDFLAALLTPTLTAAAAADASSIQLTWTPVEEAVSYELYRYSSDQGAENAAVLATVSGTSYTDTNVELEVPYYYYVIAKSADNSSNPSETVWTMVSAGHTGDYAHEDEAAVITITDCPSATVFQNAITISGTVDRAGAMKAYVNDASLTAAAAEQQVAAGGSFTLNLQLKEGRNDVRLIFTDENGTETCLTYNFVYLSNSDIDMIVDASYTGEGGTEIDGISTYKTVQAAVNAAAENAGVQRTAEKTVIFIKNGDYNERLVVDTPNISLIGESEDGVRIHCYPAELYPNDPGYEAGGDMTKRCATYITSNATGFSAENLTFANDYDYSTPDGKSNKSADALRCDADGASFVNVTFSGVQDTLYMHEGNQYFYKCRIEGLIDFIYSGDEAKALFEECELVFVYEGTHPEGGYVCAPRTAADSEYGLIFYNCSVTSEEGCEDGTFHLARPWGPNAAIYWINCYLGSAINADEPYDDMSGNLFRDANFYEYGSYGPGYAVNADRKQISPAAAKALLTAAVDALGADDGNILTDIKAGKLDPQQPQAKPPVDDPSDIPGGGNEGNTGNGGDSGNGGNTGNGSQTGGGNGGSSGSSGSGSGSVAQTTTAQGAATGDSTDIFTWVAVLIVAGAAAAAVTVRSRKKNQ